MMLTGNCRHGRSAVSDCPDCGRVVGAAIADPIAKLTAERGSVYGPPRIDFGRAARLKAVVAECKDPLARHAMEMICVKLARLINSPGHVDSWRDIAGYAKCGEEVTRPESSVEPIIP